MPSPCPTCRAPTTEALVAYVERIGELPDALVADDDCPGWAARTKGGSQAQGLPF